MKKTVLYGFSRARPAVRRGLPLMVVEGYMDVIAVTASGVAGAVAPLGTALGEDQIRLLWKLSDEPVLCFDGDKAGQTAAGRAIERVLPLLEPGRSVRLAVLPEGQDPDDILKTGGPDALRRILSSASGLLDALWAFKSAAYQLDDPRTQAGAKAAFWQEMRGLIRSIGHSQTRSAWADDLEFRITAMRGAARGSGGTQPRSGVQGRYNSSASLTPAPRRPKTGRHIQARATLALIISQPALFADYAEQLAMLDFHDEALDGLKNTVIDRLLSAPDLDAAALKHHLETDINADLMDQLFGADMTARFGGPIDKLEEARVRTVLDEMMGRLARTSQRG